MSESFFFFVQLWRPIQFVTQDLVSIHFFLTNLTTIFYCNLQQKKEKKGPRFFGKRGRNTEIYIIVCFRRFPSESKKRAVKRTTKGRNTECDVPAETTECDV